jgi:predicted nucleotidyltransferase component of viral defense system
LSAPPDRELIEAIAADLGVDPSFVEKDWHAMRLVAVVAGVTEADITPVFSGGTSLSKGYGLIQRFSEDLDFKTKLPDGGLKRSGRQTYRGRVIKAIRQEGSWSVPDEGIESRNESRFFTCRIDYTPAFEPTAALRPHVKLEMTFTPPALDTETRPVQSFVAQARDTGPEVGGIACVSPAETAADKLSALTWRVLTRERGSARDDPTLIRHLHDLAALEGQALAEPGFPGLLRNLLDQDARRGAPPAELTEMSGSDRVEAALDRLAADPEYAGEYQSFVMGMSYAATPDIPSFEQALEAAHRLRGTL